MADFGDRQSSVPIWPSSIQIVNARHRLLDLLALMALVNVKNVRVLNNPTLFTNPFQFEVTLRPQHVLP